MDAQSMFSGFRTIEGADIFVCSYWTEHAGVYEPDADLCLLSLLYNNMYFFVESPIKTRCCNQQLVQDNFFTIIRNLFSRQDKKYKYSFNAEEEEQIGIIEIQMPIDSEGKSVVSMFKATLLLYPGDDGISQFLTQVEIVLGFKDVIIEEKRKKIRQMQEIEDMMNITKQEVSILKDTTTDLVAERLLPVYNNLKDIIRENKTC